MPVTVIKNAHIIDPSQNIDAKGDIVIKDDAILSLGENAADGVEADSVIDAGGLFAAPGFIDIHVHLREPGFTHKEDIHSGCKAAAAGGFTAVVCMPNTKPAADNPDVLKYIAQKSASASARVYPCGAVSNELTSETPCDYSALKAAGAVAISNDGKPVKNGKLLMDALRACYELDMVLTNHCEDLDIIGKGIINYGEASKRLELPGMHRAAEDSDTARTIAIAECLEVPVHIAHVSTAGSVEIIRQAKARGVRVTCETAPHYFSFNESELYAKDANFRMSPPLRAPKDVSAVIKGIADGTIDVIATDHAPHAPHEKKDFLTAPNGVIGLETSFAASYTALVKSGVITLSRLVELMSAVPARVMKLPGGTLRPGTGADIVLFSVDSEKTVDSELFYSKSRNCPFEGRKLFGEIKYTLMNGNITYKNEL